MIMPYICGNIVKEVSITSDRCELTPGQDPCYLIHFYSAYGTSDWKYEKDLFITKEEAEFALYLTGNVSSVYEELF